MWEQQGPQKRLTPEVAQVLNADDYHNVTLTNGAAPSVGLFMAFYDKQGGNNGIHSPEVCLPAAGWEIAWLERTDIAEQLQSAQPFPINQAIIQKGESRMMVYYWYEQQGRQVAWDFAAKFWLFADGVRTGRADGGIVRLTTVIDPSETEADASKRLMDVLVSVQDSLPKFMPE
jgi:EpsI family protein